MFEVNYHVETQQLNPLIYARVSDGKKGKYGNLLERPTSQTVKILEYDVKILEYDVKILEYDVKSELPNVEHKSIRDVIKFY